MDTESIPKTPRECKLAEHVTAIRHLGKQTAANAAKIGRHLSECKRIVGHRNFGCWLDREFGWSERTAQRFISIYELAESKSDKLSDLELPVSALYLLAAPSTSEAVRDEIIARARVGEKVKVEDVKKEIAKARSKPAPKDRTKQERGPPGGTLPTLTVAPAVARVQEEKVTDAKVTSHPADAAQGEHEMAFARLVTRDLTQSSVLITQEQRIRTLAEEKRAIEIRTVGLESEIEELKAEIVKLEAQVAELKAELARLKAAPAEPIAAAAGPVQTDPLLGIPAFLDRRQPKPASRGEPS